MNFIKSKVKCVVAITVMIFLYLVSPLVVFNFSEVAYSFDEDYYNGKRVAFGPSPRKVFAYPSYHDFLYSGSEWPFKTYYPFCRFWVSMNGMEVPSAWRK